VHTRGTPNDFLPPQHRCDVQIARAALPRHSIDIVDMGEYVAPINRIEQVIQAAWEEVLAVEPGSIGTQMSFFEVSLAFLMPSVAELLLVLCQL
jgi:hypothetical protein